MTYKCLMVVICIFLAVIAVKHGTCATRMDYGDKFIGARPEVSINCSSVKSSTELCKANKLYDEKKYQRAISLYTDALIKEPVNPKIYESRGMAYTFNGDYREANNDFSKAIDLDKNSCDAYSGRAIILAKLGFFSYALHEINRALIISPTKAHLYLNRSTIYNSLNDDKNALADVNKTINLDKSQTLAYIKRSYYRKKEGNIDGAIDDIEIAIRLKPFDYKLYYILSAFSYKNNDKEKEMWALNKLIELKPDDDHYYNLRGISWYNRSECELALKDFDNAIRINGRNAEYFYNRGRANMFKGLYRNAIDDLRKSMKIDRSSIDSNKLLIKAYIKVCEYNFAVKELETLIKKRPNDSALINALAWILSTCPDKKIRNGELALKLLDNVKTYKDHNIEIVDTRAAAYAEIGDYKKAIILEESVIKELKGMGNRKKFEEYRTRLDFYRRNKPWRDTCWGE